MTARECISTWTSATAQAGDRAGSLQAIQRAIEILTTLARRNPENRGYQRKLSQFYSVSGDAYVILGKDLAEGLKRQAHPWRSIPRTRTVGKDGLEPGNVPRSQTARSAPHDRIREKGNRNRAPKPATLACLGHGPIPSGNWAAAIDSLEKSMILQNGGEGVDLYTAAMAYWQTGNKTRAREFFQKADAWSKEHVVSADLEGLDGEAASLVAFGR